MTAMKANNAPWPDLVVAVRTTMENRVEQRAIRILFAISTAAIFHPLTGLVPALLWLGVILLLQGLEFLVFAGGRVRHRKDAGWALVLIFTSNSVFAAFAVLEALSGDIIGVACGILLIGGALVHAVLASGCSRLTVGAAAVPPTIVCLLLPLVMLTHGFDLTSVAMLGSAGALLCWAAFAAWRRLSDDMIVLDTARQAADRANRAKSDFLTMISHEIRTPLNGIMGMAQSLARDPLTSSQRDRLETLISSGQGLHDMIAEVLDLSCVEGGLLPLASVPFDLRGVVETSIEPFNAIAREKGIQVTTSLCPGLASAYLGDPVRIRQVLHNLISNAVQLTDSDSVLVSASRDADGVRLSVCDSGRGVPEDRLAGIFDKHSLQDPATVRADGGSGLGSGLVMANELVQRMQGSIAATNRIPTGLCLTITLPLAIAAIAPAPEPVDDTPADLPGALRVLVAEDHPVNRKVLSLLLGQIDVVPTLVENGLQAVQACRDNVWDLVLMDIQMPVLDGVSAARQIREEALAAGRTAPPVIAVTANVMAHQLQNYIDAGMKFCVSKPIQAGTLFEIMQEALGEASALQQTRKVPSTGNIVRLLPITYSNYLANIQ
ncbi:MAG: response regulator [Brevundimonas sp.]